jgi:hypothetical protein
MRNLPSYGSGFKKNLPLWVLHGFMNGSCTIRLKALVQILGLSPDRLEKAWKIFSAAGRENPKPSVG